MSIYCPHVERAGSTPYREQVVDFRDLLAKFKSICQDAARDCPNTINRLLSRRTVSEGAGQFCNLGDPPAIVFVINFDH
jgi:hypothetical protein